jgi:DNA repair protein RadC
MAKTEMQAEALANARAGQSVMNYAAIFEGFAAKGIAEADIKPRENVFTFHAWKALGRSVKAGEHGVKVVTFVPIKDKETGEVTGRRAHTTVVFHISQTELTSEREARRASKPKAVTPSTPQVAALPGMSPMGFREQLQFIAGALRDDMMKKPVFSSFTAVVDYLSAAMMIEPIEQFRCLFLDKRNRLIADEVMGHGTVEHAPVYPREILRRAIQLNACAIILSHNHPSGDPTPSWADIEMTKTIIETTRVLGIAVHDHIIVGVDSHSSFKALRLI